jgi:hypothetical protein
MQERGVVRRRKTECMGADHSQPGKQGPPSKHEQALSKYAAGEMGQGHTKGAHPEREDKAKARAGDRESKESRLRAEGDRNGTGGKEKGHDEDARKAQRRKERLKNVAVPSSRHKHSHHLDTSLRTEATAAGWDSTAYSLPDPPHMEPSLSDFEPPALVLGTSHASSYKSHSLAASMTLGGDDAFRLL